MVSIFYNLMGYSVKVVFILSFEVDTLLHTFVNVWPSWVGHVSRFNILNAQGVVLVNSVQVSNLI